MELVSSSIRPKQEDGIFNGQRYTLTYDRNAPRDKCWVWQVKYTVSYEFVGNAPDLPIAHRKARDKIREMDKTLDR